MLASVLFLHAPRRFLVLGGLLVHLDLMSMCPLGLGARSGLCLFLGLVGALPRP